MRAIKIDAKEDTPKIYLDPENNVFEISGRSLPEDAQVFYEPIISWLREYSTKPNKETVFQFKLNYFNTASSKLILDVLMILEEIHQEGNDLKVKWLYEENDEDMEEAGEEYAELVEIPFEHVAY